MTPPDPTAPPWPTRPPAEPPWLPAGHPALGVSPRSAGPPDRPAPCPGPPRRGPLVAAVAVAAVLAVVAAGVAGALVRSPGPEDGLGAADPTTAPLSTAPPSTDPPVTAPPVTPRPGAPAPPPGGATADPAVARAEIDRLQRYVEGVRGLTFARPVEVAVQGDAEFRTGLRAAAAEEADGQRREGDRLQAVGLVPPGYDVVAGVGRLLDDAVLGYYEPRTGRLAVRGGAEFTPFLRGTIVHELTHALDDQRFRLDRPDLDRAPDDRGWAFAALVEGSAKRVEQQYVAELSPVDRAAYDREAMELGLRQQQILAAEPLVLTRLQVTPYDFGYPFVAALTLQGGTAALDAAFARPPATSEQVVSVDHYRRNEPALPVDVPPSEGERLADGTLGQVETGFLLHGQDTNALGVLLDPGADPQATADLMDRLARGELDLGKLLGGQGNGGSGGFAPIDSPAGWGGDRYVVYRPPAGGVCLRVDWRMDSPAALADLRRQLQAWAAADGRARIEDPAADRVRATRCAPPP